LTETNGAWTIARNTDVPDGFTYSAKLSNVTANNQVALVQFIESINAKKFQNKKVSLSFYAKTIGNEIANLRAAVLSWTGTADNLTSDVIATWAQDGNNPTWATNWTMENTPSNLALTSSYQQFKIENINIDTTGMTNLAVVIWVDDGTIASGDDFYITGIQLNVGEVALPFQPKSYEEELRACQRYAFYIRRSETNNETAIGQGLTNSTTQAQIYINFPNSMRIAPTTISHSTLSGDNFFLWEGSNFYNVTNFYLGASSRIKAVVYSTVSGITVSRPVGLFIKGAGAYFGFEAEL
jgi:hypothetical protein